MSNGSYLYSKDKKINQILNQLTQSDNSAQFQTGTTNGMFSVPGSHLHSDNPLSEDELGIIIEYEEESERLGNFERIFPLVQNAAHYAKFFEYERPSNELLAKYLKILPQHVN